MDACPVMEMDGGRNQKSLLARLVIAFSGAIGASDNHTLSFRNVETPTDTFCVILYIIILGAPLHTSNDLHLKIIDHSPKRVA